MPGFTKVVFASLDPQIVRAVDAVGVEHTCEVRLGSLSAVRLKQ